jgi:hypothetical protein
MRLQRHCHERLTHDLFEKQAGSRQAAGALRRERVNEVVPDREQAGGLDTNEWNAFFDEWRRCCDEAPGFRASLIDEAGFEKCSPAAVRPVAFGWGKPVDAKSACRENIGGGPQRDGIEMAVECILKQKDLCAFAVRRGTSGGKRGCRPMRSWPVRAEPGQAFRQPATPGQKVT